MPKQQIARTLGTDRKTIGRYIALAVAQGATPGPQAGADLTDERLEGMLAALRRATGRPYGDSWDRCVAQRAFIEDKLRSVKLSKVQRLLRRQGVEFPYPTLRRFAIEECGYGRRASTIPVADGEPGRELQLDTGWVGVLEPDLFGKRRRLRAWIFPPWSRATASSGRSSMRRRNRRSRCAPSAGTRSGLRQGGASVGTPNSDSVDLPGETLDDLEADVASLPFVPYKQEDLEDHHLDNVRAREPQRSDDGAL